MNDLLNGGQGQEPAGYNPFLAPQDDTNPFLTPPAERAAPAGSSRAQYAAPATAPAANGGQGFGTYDSIVASDAKSSRWKTWKGVFSTRKLGSKQDENVDYGSPQVQPQERSAAPARNVMRTTSEPAMQSATPQPRGSASSSRLTSSAAAEVPAARHHPAAAMPPRPTPGRAAAAPARPQAHVQATLSEPFDPAATLPAFHAQVSKIKADLATIEEQKREMVLLHDVAKKLTKTAELQAAQADMTQLVEGIRKGLATSNKAIQAVQQSNGQDYTRSVDAIDVDAADEEVDAARDKLTSIFQLRAQVTIGLVAKFNKMCDSFKEFECRVAQEYHEDVKRRLQIVTNDDRVDDEQVEALIDSGQAETVFKQALMQSRGEAILELRRVVQERHEGMQKLYKDMLQLNQMMLDFSVLVHEQGKMIDNIADQVSSTADYIRRGTDELLRAKAHKKKSAKVKSAVALAGAGVAAAGVATVAITAAGLAAPLAM